MDKVTINNQVVFMRKFVKQAKIRAINNYTKEIRLLQNRKGNDDETSKHKRKAERLLSKVAILRKIQPDSVSRKALSKEKDWKAVLKEKNIPLEDQCYAMLANYGPIQSEVEKFHKKYWDLVPKIPTLFKDWEKISKDPITKQQKKKAKQFRRSMKTIKLEKNNPNATPIGPNKTALNKTTPNSKAPLDSLVKDERNGKVTENSSDDDKQVKSKNSATAMPSQTDSNESEASDNEDEQINKTEMISDVENFDKRLSKELTNTDLEQKNEDHEVENESETCSLDSNSESGDPAEEESIEDSHESDLELETIPTPEVIKEPKKGKEAISRQQKNSKNTKSALKPQGIQARLKEIADNPQNINAKNNQKSNLIIANSAKKSESNNSLKAVTMLNLNELRDFDEIPIEKATNVTEETGENKRKKDPFFLGKGGEIPSESEEESANPGHEISKKRKLDNFDRKSSSGDFFKRNFPVDSSQNPKLGFRKNDFQRNRKSSNFEDGNNSFKNRGRQSSEFKDKEFRNKRETKFFGEKPTGQFKQNVQQKGSNKEHFQKNKLMISPKKNIADDKPLHPSWEAKKKLKDAAKSKFQGKRIVFGD